MFRILRLSGVELSRIGRYELKQVSHDLLTNSSLLGSGFSINMKTTTWRIEGRRHWLRLEFLQSSGVERKCEVVAEKLRDDQNAYNNLSLVAECSLCNYF